MKEKEQRIEQVINNLVCPKSKRPMRREGERIVCDDCGFEGIICDGVVSLLPKAAKSYFDDKFETMREGHEGSGEWQFCYEEQVALLESYLGKDKTILDIGCGPSVPYRVPEGGLVIGLEPSFESIRANPEVDVKIHGSAYEIPFPAASVDVVVCFYSLHHMVGETIDETKQNVVNALKEFERITKPGGYVFVFEMTPVWAFSVAQEATWNFARKLLRDKLDMYFWPTGDIERVGETAFGRNGRLEKLFFGVSGFVMFPPMFSLPWIKIPRFLYPLDAKLYRWQICREEH
jgi:SAM-dependent methyltransferase